MAKYENLYKLIEQQCNAEQVRALLRRYKDTNKETKKEINVSAPKDDLIKNLSRVVALKMIPLGEAIDLLREAEENGQQHIFYYKPRNAMVRAKCKDFDNVVEAIIGSEWEDDFPLFDFLPDEYQWVDVRKGIADKSNNWILKAYGQEQFFERTKVENPSPQRRIEYFNAETIRVVCVVRWNEPDLLEVRIDSQRLESTKAKVMRLKQIWQMLDNALKESEFVPWDLSRVWTYMTNNRIDHADFSLGDLRLVDGEGGVSTFKTNTSDESVDDLKARSKAINALTTDLETKCDSLNIHWNIPRESADAEPSQLATVCGGRNTHELVVRARTAGRAINHVTNKLREFSARSP